MFELKKKYLSGKEKVFFMKLYNESLKEYNLNDIPDSFLMFLRFMEEWKSFYEKLQEKNFSYDFFDVKIIYSNYK